MKKLDIQEIKTLCAIRSFEAIIKIAEKINEIIEKDKKEDFIKRLKPPKGFRHNDDDFV